MGQNPHLTSGGARRVLISGAAIFFYYYTPTKEWTVGERESFTGLHTVYGVYIPVCINWTEKDAMQKMVVHGFRLVLSIVVVFMDDCKLGNSFRIVVSGVRSAISCGVGALLVTFFNGKKGSQYRENQII